MDPTLIGLLQHCAESPHDSTPHLILADWLDDHDQSERAELVRVQCRLADWVPEIEEREGLLQRQTTLIAAHRDRWLGPIQGACTRVEFVRGLARIWVPSREFARPGFGQAYAEIRSTALVERVRLLRCQSLSRVAPRPWIGFAPSLSLAQLGLPPGALTYLLNSEHMESLIDLDLSGNDLDHQDLVHLIESNLFARLGRLALRNANLLPAGTATLLDAAPSSLRALDLAGNRLTAQTIADLQQRQPPGRVMNSLGLEFIRIPPGVFRMGSRTQEPGALNDQYPQHLVRLTRPYWLGRFAITQEDFRTVLHDNPSRFTSHSPSLPVENVDYDSALEFCRRLSDLPAERKAGRAYRLPTEAEWEHACRAGTTTAYYWGDSPSPDLFNYRAPNNSGEAVRRSPGRPMPIGSYPPNGFGLHEMHGNIWEWTSDWYSMSWYGRSPQVDPVGPAEDGEREGTRAIRGGCWHAVEICCRSAHRFGEDLDTRDDYTGFRVVMVPGERGASAP